VPVARRLAQLRVATMSVARMAIILEVTGSVLR
jgi:hypothetical protein